jgi:hypothetical protein
MTDADDKTTARPKNQSQDDAVKQAKDDALSPADKHKNYLEDLERLHKESVVDSLGHTPRAG